MDSATISNIWGFVAILVVLGLIAWAAGRAGVRRREREEELDLLRKIARDNDDPSGSAGA